MRQVAVVLVSAAMLLAGTSAVQAKPIHPVPYEPLPASFEELPQGAPTTLPWWQDGVLHLGGTTIETKLSRINHRNGTTVVGKGTGYPGSQTEWYLVVGERLKPLVVGGATPMPRISANGRWVAWLKETQLSEPEGELGGTDTLHELVVYDVRQRRVRGTFRNRRVVYDDGINGMGLWGLDNRGRAFFGLGGRDWFLRAGRVPVSLKGRRYPSYGMDTWPRGIFRYAQIQEIGIYGTVDRRGRFTQVGRISEPRSGAWSRRGEAFFRQDYDNTTFWVDRVEDGLSIQLGLPDYDGYGLRAVGWESDADVIVWLREGDGHDKVSVLVRCDAVTGDCERASGGPDGASRAEMQALS